VAHAHPTPILSLPTDSFTVALGNLDPANRALLDLSLRRGMRPEEIGELLGTDPESVIVAREHALEQLSAELGAERAGDLDDVRARLAELPSEAWTPGMATPPEPARPNLALVDEEEAPAAVAAPEEPRRSRGRLPLLLALLAAAAVALVVFLVTRGDDGKQQASAPTRSAPAPQPAPAKPEPPPAEPAARQVPLKPVAGAARGAEGTASLAEGGKRLVIDVSGLPSPRGGSYQVWLYDSVIEARSLGAGRGTKLALDLKLPAAAPRYRFVDISREPADGNTNHSGASVLRVPLERLSR
jgi:hypothetical protein